MFTQRKFRRPSSFYSSVNGVIAFTEEFTPFSKWFGYAVYRVLQGYRSITSLFSWSCPTAIAGLVIAFIIWPSVKFHSGCTFPHILNEYGVISPSRTDIDDSKVPFEMRIIASLNHSTPSLIRKGEFAPFGVPMLKVPFSNGLIMETAAGLGMAAQKVNVNHNDLFTAIAHASASGMPVFVRREVGMDKKSCKSFTNEGFSFRHSISRLNVVQVAGARRIPGICGDPISSSFPVNNV